MRVNDVGTFFDVKLVLQSPGRQKHQVLSQPGVSTIVSCRSPRKSLQAVARGLVVMSVAVGLMTPMNAHAQFTGNASATGQFESNSNVFNLDSGVPQPGTTAHPQADTFLAYGAAFDLRYLWSKQELYASASTTEFNYQRFTELNHDDYKFDTGLNWVLGELLDGKVEVKRTRTMVPFFDLAGTTLSLSTEQRESALVGLKVTPEWRIEGSAYTYTLDEPIPQAPNLQAKESSGTATAKYLGIAGFTSGVYVGYLSGSFQGTNGTLNPDYHQTSEGLVATYGSSRSTLDGQIGYSRRTSTTGTDNTSGVTGKFKLKDQLTPKTDVAIELGRAINSYLLNAGSEIDTSAGVTANWQTTYKLLVSLGYTYTYRDYPRQGNNPVGSNRIDHEQYATLGVDYRPQRWIIIKPYLNFLTRNSDYIGGDFNSTIIGVYVTILTPQKSKARTL
jgi:hypothetical protein